MLASRALQRALVSTMVLLVVAWLVPGPLRVQAASANLCSQGIRDVHIPDQCFPPRQVSLAERGMPTKVIRPLSVVRRVTALHLTQVELRDPARPIAIDYLFGQLSFDDRPPPRLVDLTVKKPRYVIVEELLFRLPPGARPVYSVPTYINTNRVVGYWVFEGNFPCGPLSLTVRSNGPKRWVTQIGHALLRAEVCGKDD